MALRQIKAMAVFCGSNLGSSNVYANGARCLGTAIARAGIVLVYGGGTKGLMGVVADAALAAGGTVHGIITDGLHKRGHSHAGLTRHEIVPTMRTRKERMTELADAFIAMPGGIGTVEELMEVWTLNQLSEIDKPVGLLDVDGFFAPFLTFIDRMVEAKFLPAAHRHSVCVDAEAGLLIEKLQTFERTSVSKWM
jgi:uncharacterized protein (TIGR00730 family)